MKEKTNSPALVWAWWNKGFASLYALGMLLSIAAVCTVELTMQVNRLQTAVHLHRTEAYLSQEAVVLSYVKCAIKNEVLKDEAAAMADVTFSITPGRPLIVVIQEPLFEILEIEWDQESQRLLDYSCMRPLEDQISGLP
jgi:hypothetical protein